MDMSTKVLGQNCYLVIGIQPEVRSCQLKVTTHTQLAAPSEYFLEKLPEPRPGRTVLELCCLTLSISPELVAITVFCLLQCN